MMMENSSAREYMKRTMREMYRFSVRRVYLVITLLAVSVCRRGQVVKSDGLALLLTFAREARVLSLATAHTGTGRLSRRR